jgi:hypothetical protein
VYINVKCIIWFNINIGVGIVGIYRKTKKNYKLKINYIKSNFLDFFFANLSFIRLFILLFIYLLVLFLYIKTKD